MTKLTPLQQFSAGLKALNLQLSDDKQQHLIWYLELLSKWNRRFNLTGIHDLNKMVSYHLLDSLAIAPYVTGQCILDAGTGAGFPGIPLACYFPEKNFVLADSVGKKTRFIEYAQTQLQLPNVRVITSRVEQLCIQHKRFDCIISRAFSALKPFIELTQSCAHNQTCWVAMKGQLMDVEINEISDLYNIDIIKLNVPGIDAIRQVVIIQEGK